MYLFIYLLINIFIYVFIYLFIYVFIYLFMYLFVRLLKCMFNCLHIFLIVISRCFSILSFTYLFLSPVTVSGVELLTMWCPKVAELLLEERLSDEGREGRGRGRVRGIEGGKETDRRTDRQ